MRWRDKPHPTLRWMGRQLRFFLVLLVSYLIQVCLMPYVRILDVTPNLLLAVIFRKKRVKEEDDEEDEDYLDDLPPVGESQKPAAKPEPADAVEVKPVETEVIEPDPIYAEPEPAAPEVIEMPAPEAPAAPETPAE